MGQVVWVPDPQLRALAPDNDYGAKQIIDTLEEWDLTEWGLPKIRVSSLSYPLVHVANVIPD